jgi:hypothetical protein
MNMNVSRKNKFKLYKLIPIYENNTSRDDFNVRYMYIYTMYVYIYVCIYIYVYVCIYSYIHIFIYTYIHIYIYMNLYTRIQYRYIQKISKIFQKLRTVQTRPMGGGTKTKVWKKKEEILWALLAWKAYPWGMYLFICMCIFMDKYEFICIFIVCVCRCMYVNIYLYMCRNSMGTSGMKSLPVRYITIHINVCGCIYM